MVVWKIPLIHSCIPGISFDKMKTQTTSGDRATQQHVILFNQVRSQVLSECVLTTALHLLGRGGGRVGEGGEVNPN